jgi:hypothetical protein
MIGITKFISNTFFVYPAALIFFGIVLPAATDIYEYHDYSK